MSDDGFSDPDTVNGSGKPGVYKPGEKVRHGKWGWYDLPNPETGEPALYQRASTVAKILADTYHLDRWKLRVAVKGTAIRPDLAALAHSMDVKEDREALDKVVDQAMDAAGAHVGANLGTAQHAYAERLDRGEDMGKVRLSPAVTRDLSAYRAEMERNRLAILPKMMERVVLSSRLGICGRLDRVLYDQDSGEFLIGDLKSGATVDFGGLDFAVQLSIYANADWIWSEELARWERMPEAVNRDRAVVMHLPVGMGRCELFSVDIATGYRCAKLALTVKETRKRGKGLMQPWVNDGRFRKAIESAITTEDLSAVWREATQARMWTKELEQLGILKMKSIQNQPREISA